MTSQIPILSNVDGAEIVASIFTDSDIVRLPIDKAASLKSKIPSTSKLWMDHCIDGFDDLAARITGGTSSWNQAAKKCPSYLEIGDRTFISKPDAAKVEAFVHHVLSECNAHAPKFITIPQLPLCPTAERNKLNRMLASATGKWKNSSRFSGKMILPIIATKSSQIAKKSDRNPKVEQATKCYEDSDASGYWVVDSGLEDEKQSVGTRRVRFDSVIALHKELNTQITSKLRIGGPYWGLNLVLWARDLIDHPAIGLGTGYRYFLSGQQGNKPTTRIAIPCLRRRIRHDGALKWLEEALDKIEESHPAFAELSDLLERHPRLASMQRAKEQVCGFYKTWIERIESVPKAGRPISLYQDLSQAYSLGKTFPDLAAEDGPIRSPSSIAEALMMSCL